MDGEKEEKSQEIKEIPGLPKAELAALEADGNSEEAAVKEAKQLSRGHSIDDLKREAAEHEHHRNEGFRDLFDSLIKFGLKAAGIATLLIGITSVLWRKRHWPNQLSRLRHDTGPRKGGV